MDEPDVRREQQPDLPVEPAGQYTGPDPAENAAEPAPAGGGQGDPTSAYDEPFWFGAPTPPPPSGTFPPLPPTSYAAPPPPPPAPRRRTLRLLAAGTAVAVVAAAGGLGFALGRSHHDSAADGSFNGPGGQGSQGGEGFGGSPFDGDEGSRPFGGAPFSGPDGGRDGSPSDSSNSTPASTDQLTGLVRVAATLKYAGGEAAGTGMVLTSSGEVVTNHHVVAGATSVKVKVMSTGTTYRAEVVGTDAADDVAVLQLEDATGLATVTPDSDGIGVGDDVTAVGDAGGSTSTFSAADGTITATGKDITTHSEGGRTAERLRGLIEISSDVISGDSGGATYDDEGEVVGMTTAASSGSSDVVGYAIPIAKVLRIADDLENGTENARYEYGTPAFLGLGLDGDDTQVGGVYPGTPAAEAGVVAGDIVTRVGSTRVRTADALRAAITAHSPGDRVQIAWEDASGTSHIATVTLMEGPVA